MKDVVLFPVGRRRIFGRRDRMDDLPYGWCRCCGMEVRVWGRQVCRRCEEEGEEVYSS